MNAQRLSRSSRPALRAGFSLLAFLAMTLTAAAQTQDAIPINQDEAKVPPYTLPDPLKFADGRALSNATEWPARRAELLNLFATEVYGKTPTASIPMVAKLVEHSVGALGGKATRLQLTLIFGTAPNTVSADLLVYLPKLAADQPVPVVLGFNFEGNHAVQPDPAIRISPGWFRDEPKGSHPGNLASEKDRGSEASRWDIEQAIDRGYGVATMYYGDIDPDFDDGFHNGIHPLLDPAGTADPDRPKDSWGSIGAWAWGLSRCLDALETMPGVDAKKVAVLGHSRLGKAALWAAAQDQRFALVISNQSGCGGAALSKRDFGETVKRINTSFPHWFCDKFETYNGNEAALPVDQHELLALIAPRPLLVCSAAEDLWADPKGEYLSCVGADPVYRLLTGDGLNAKSMPAPNERVWGRLMYHIRPGKHDVTPQDWTLYLDFADKLTKAP
jgi:hypothetical protein